MAITPLCAVCNQKLAEFGAILLSPPNKESNVKKFHVCVVCYHKLIKDLKLSERS